MAISHGMNIEEVRSLGQRLKQESQNLQNIMSSLQGLVQNTTWVGPDAQQFKGPWWDGHRGNLQKIVQDLDGFGQSAINNATEQENVSGR